MGVGGQRHAPATLPRGKRHGAPCTGVWVDPRAGLDECGRTCLPQGLDSLAVQPVAVRYTD
jgi:hypothetical protein